MRVAIIDPGKNIELRDIDTPEDESCFDVAIKLLKEYLELIGRPSECIYADCVYDSVSKKSENVVAFVDGDGRVNRLPVNRKYITRSGRVHLLAGRIVLAQAFVNFEGNFVTTDMTQKVFNEISGINGGDGSAEWQKATQEESDNIDSGAISLSGSLEEFMKFMEEYL